MGGNDCKAVRKSGSDEPNMKKILVIGCPGSGKSTFSRALRDKTGISICHMDALYWNDDGTTADKEIFLNRLSEVMRREEWIIDGNYSSTLEWRMDACDTVFFLDYPVDVCLDGVEKRRGKARSDMPWIETAEDFEFTEFIKNFEKNQRPFVLETLEKHADKTVVVFHNRKEAEDYITSKMTRF